MKRPSRARPSVECLEDRCCPSVTAKVTAGSLVVTGSTSALTITEVSQGQFQVLDGTTSRGTFAVTHDVDVTVTTPGNDPVAVNLNGHVAPGNVNIQLGGGNPTLSVFGGVITGDLNVVSGGTLAVSSAVVQDLIYRGTNTGPEALTVQPTAVVRGNVQAIMGNGVDAANLDGVIGGNLLLETGAGNDQVNLGGFVAHQAIVLLGTGNNTFTLTGTVGAPGSSAGSLYVNAGPGVNALGLAGTAAVHGNLWADLGVGEDFVAVGAGFQVGWGLVDIGTGAAILKGFYLPPVNPHSYAFTLAAV